MNRVVDPQAGVNEQASFARSAVRSIPVSARGVVVNRTHRVVRERAQALQMRRNRDRSLMAPLLLCSVLLILSVFAVWTGLYQYQTAEAVQADLASLATTDNNHILVVLLWFVPVFIAVLTTVWVRRSRKNADDEAL